jgi:hypothetical protein
MLSLAQNIRFKIFSLSTKFSKLINWSTLVIFSLFSLSQVLAPRLLLLFFALLLLLVFTWRNVLSLIMLLWNFYLSNFVSQLVSPLVLLLFISWYFLLLNFTLSLRLLFTHSYSPQPVAPYGRISLVPVLALKFYLIHFVHFISFTSLLSLMRLPLYLV